MKNKEEKLGYKFIEGNMKSRNVNHPYCQDTCILNGKVYNYYDVPNFNIGKYFCIEDCAYKNKQAGEIRCVC
jgi:hypothetical protein